ncbi:MAM domain-containing glycosylphosphatidylinositol anchor protein 2-like isoform X2 [Dreissena polymorpha]|uniref:MAM domain-containing glycosylphosphatidylinositol anchor protein 2-like isoform X2 n=1 Tax=Dreissena polymorpha TaxID=45954 RepID=UPI002264F9D1|nr:MAM domain-containing glycosylphosphatidylinositol anchor protein 2-like isoform X2 [Dreissena polymorpha]
MCCWISYYLSIGTLWIASLASSRSINCTFDADLCQWTQAKNDDFDWTRHTGSTPTDGTGPTTDHGGSGFYLFIETSAPRALDEQSFLISPFIDTWNHVTMCFQMFYHANGASLGDLHVSLETSGYVNSTVQEFSGPLNSSDTWEKIAFTIRPISKFQISIRGTVGNGFLGDIAIDDVSVAPGACPP